MTTLINDIQSNFGYHNQFRNKMTIFVNFCTLLKLLLSVLKNTFLKLLYYVNKFLKIVIQHIPFINLNYYYINLKLIRNQL